MGVGRASVGQATGSGVGGGAWQEVRVSLGADAEVTGKLSFVSPTRIEGKLRGEVRSSDLLIVGPQAVVEATVRAEKLVVLGEIRGEIVGATRVEICSGGRVYGNIETRSVVVQEGAVFEGRCRMSQPAASKHQGAAGSGSGAAP